MGILAEPLPCYSADVRDTARHRADTVRQAGGHAHDGAGQPVQATTYPATGPACLFVAGDGFASGQPGEDDEHGGQVRIRPAKLALNVPHYPVLAIRNGHVRLLGQLTGDGPGPRLGAARARKRRNGQRRDNPAIDMAAAPTATATAPTATLFAIVAVVATLPLITHGVMIVQIPTIGATQAMPCVRP